MLKKAHFKIGEAATASGVPAKMIRYYERIGLLRSVSRTTHGYRLYCDADIRALRLIRLARSVGISIVGCRELLRLLSGRMRRVDRETRAMKYAQDLEAKMSALQTLILLLRQVAESEDSENAATFLAVGSSPDNSGTATAQGQRRGPRDWHHA
ncbi:MerR family transcriptional regulator [Microvirga sp. VF16]|uniref:MerR family transcriptional regulator n=1 Tax=Microvirga sp. VF16 TaxID=2807101 RepID=UPI00193CF6B9|nr:MerR family transcriptional regulator [Microvirga sp. VF16]QRM34671.1 MerR family transcriptional regulator [Microvirga sp. VF16]